MPSSSILKPGSGQFIIRIIKSRGRRWDGACSTHRRILVCNSEGKIPLGRLSHRLEDNIKTEPKKIRV